MSPLVFLPQSGEGLLIEVKLATWAATTSTSSSFAATTSLTAASSLSTATSTFATTPPLTSL